MQDTIVKEIARQFAGRFCWLDGKEAKITGKKNRFATVSTMDGKMSFEYSWHTVNRVMRSHCQFRS